VHQARRFFHVRGQDAPGLSRAVPYHFADSKSNARNALLPKDRELAPTVAQSTDLGGEGILALPGKAFSPVPPQTRNKRGFPGHRSVSASPTGPQRSARRKMWLSHGAGGHDRGRRPGGGALPGTHAGRRGTFERPGAIMAGDARGRNFLRSKSSTSRSPCPEPEASFLRAEKTMQSACSAWHKGFLNKTPSVELLQPSARTLRMQQNAKARVRRRAHVGTSVARGKRPTPTRDHSPRARRQKGNSNPAFSSVATLSIRPSATPHRRTKASRKRRGRTFTD